MAWTKDPDAVLDYTFDWTKWLNDGDVIVSASFSIEPDNGELSISGTDFNRKYATVLLSGGVIGNTYEVRCRVNTKDLLTDDRTQSITIKGK